jgi:DNA-binding PadR family transcriptional regulator
MTISNIFSKTTKGVNRAKSTAQKNPRKPAPEREAPNAPSEILTLTDLEGAALAEVARRGTATSFAIANTFAQSPSEYWSGSAGAMYPLVQRLAKKGYLSAQAGATGKRQKLDYSITDLGRTALESWLLDAGRAAGMGFDPLRTRLFYLELVTPKQRQKFLTQVRALGEGEHPAPSFAGNSWAIQIHESWWQARKIWHTLLEFVSRK